MTQDYVVFDMQALYEMAHTIWYNLGNIVSVCFYLFVIVLSVFLVFHIVSDFSQ